MLTKDFYVTPLSYEDGRSQSHSHSGRQVTMNKGDVIDYNGNKITFDNFNFPADAMSAMMGGGTFEIGAALTIDGKDKTYKIEPKMVSEGGGRNFVSAKVEEIDLLVEMTNLDASGTVNLILKSISNKEVSEPEVVMNEVLAIEASIKPFINLVWAGVILMVAGFIISAVRRTKET